MDNLLDTFLSPVWWVTVVFVGLLINLISAYIKSPLDRVLSKVSSWWRTRSEAVQKQREVDIQWLVENPSDQVHYLAEEWRCRLRTVGWVLFAVLFFSAATAAKLEHGNTFHRVFATVLMVGSICCLMVSMTQQLEAMKWADMVREARRRRRAEHKVRRDQD